VAGKRRRTTTRPSRRSHVDEDDKRAFPTLRRALVGGGDDVRGETFRPARPSTSGRPGRPGTCAMRGSAGITRSCRRTLRVRSSASRTAKRIGDRRKAGSEQTDPRSTHDDRCLYHPADNRGHPPTTPNVAVERALERRPADRVVTSEMQSRPSDDELQNHQHDEGSWPPTKASASKSSKTRQTRSCAARNTRPSDSGTWTAPMHRCSSCSAT
jgi:hypothetical protein